MKEITPSPRAVILGVSLGALLAAANTYLGLYAGMTLSASIPAAVMATQILRHFSKEKNFILESNIIQTIAASGTGIIFTVPALLISGVWQNVWFWSTWKEHTRYLGIGAMAVAGIWSLIAMRKGVIDGIREAFTAYQEKAGR